MSIYEKFVLPRLIELAMRNSRLAGYRHATISAANGRVLEIGLGSGLNLPIYGAAVDQVYGIDPSPELLDRARKRIGDARVPVSLIRASAERLPFADAQFDTVVMTWTLCSIPNPSAALVEMRRVLKPSGRLLFVEHGLSPEPGITRWQHRLTPCWRRLGGGCHLDRKIDDLIRAAGFQVNALETAPLPRDPIGGTTITAAAITRTGGTATGTATEAAPGLAARRVFPTRVYGRSRHGWCVCDLGESVGHGLLANE